MESEGEEVRGGERSSVYHGVSPRQPIPAITRGPDRPVLMISFIKQEVYLSPAPLIVFMLLHNPADSVVSERIIEHNQNSDLSISKDIVGKHTLMYIKTYKQLL